MQNYTFFKLLNNFYKLYKFAILFKKNISLCPNRDSLKISIFSKFKIILSLKLLKIQPCKINLITPNSNRLSSIRHNNTKSISFHNIDC